MQNFISKDIYYFLLLTLIGGSVYFSMLDNQLLDLWDDGWMVKNHYTEGGFNFTNLLSILVEFYHGQYAPLNEYFYLLIYSISNEYNPFLYHLACLVLHLANACLVFSIIKKLLIMSNRIDLKNIQIISFLTALIFTIHPLNVESVAWVSASKVLVFAFFYLCAAYTFLLFLATEKFRYFVLTLFLFIFSFLGKEQAVTFPIMILLFFWFLKYKILSQKVLWVIVPFFLLSFFFGIITILSQEGYTSSSFNNYSFTERCVYACYSFVEYICKSTFPIKLSYLYPFITLPGNPLPTWLLMYPLFLLITLITLGSTLKNWPIAFGVMFFTIHISIVLHIIPLSRFAVIADRYVYLPSIGFGFILAYYLVKFCTILKKEKQIILITSFSFYLLYFSVYSNIRTRTWYNSDTLKQEIRELLNQRDNHPTKNTILQN